MTHGVPTGQMVRDMDIALQPKVCRFQNFISGRIIQDRLGMDAWFMCERRVPKDVMPLRSPMPITLVSMWVAPPSSANRCVGNGIAAVVVSVKLNIADNPLSKRLHQIVDF